MSISGLSNHLYVVVTTIISLLVAPSTFHQTSASPVSDDFTESRQFKKNLAVSKYKDNPYWLPDYAWKPPEKFYGPRKRPKWEMETNSESRSTSLKKKELEKWEQKMREVSNRARRKWKIYEAQEKLQPKSDKMISGHTNKKFVSDENARSIVNDDEDIDAPDEWMKNLHNGRWGLSVDEPAVEGSSTDSTKRIEKSNPVRQQSEGTTLRGIISDGRWGMSVKKAPKEFIKEISKSKIKSFSTDPLVSSDTRNSMVQPDDGDASAATIPNGRWGMSVKKAPKNFMKEISKSQIKSRRTNSPKSLETRNSMRQPNDVTERAETFTNGRWGMSIVHGAPTNFIKDEISKSQLNESLSPDPLESFESTNSMRQPDGVTRAAMISIGRWGMSVKKAPKNFMKEISKSQIKSRPTDSPKSLETRNSMRQPNDDTERAETFTNGRWGMSVHEAPTNFIKDEISKSQLNESLSPDPLESFESTTSMRQPDGVTRAAMISNGRRGMNVKKAPKEFLKEMSRRSQTLAISDRVWKQDEDRKSTGNRKIHDGSEVRVKEVSVAEGPVETNLPKVFPSGRWAMRSDLPPREFLREISRCGLSGISEFYKSTAVHQRAHEIVKNNPQSRELMFSQMLATLNILFPRLFPSLIGLPICPIYLLINLNILPDCNCASLTRILNQRQFSQCQEYQ